MGTESNTGDRHACIYVMQRAGPAAGNQSRWELVIVIAKLVVEINFSCKCRTGRMQQN